MAEAAPNIELNPSIDQLRDKMSGNVIYNPKKLEDNGWCEITGKDTQSGQWGVCSPACKEASNLV